MDPIIVSIIAGIIAFGVLMLIFFFVVANMGLKQNGKWKEAARKSLQNPDCSQEELEEAYSRVVGMPNDGDATLLAGKLKKRLGL